MNANDRWKLLNLQRQQHQDQHREPETKYHDYSTHYEGFRQHDPIGAKIEAFLKKDFQLPPADPRWGDIPEIVGTEVEKKDFSDEEWFGVAALSLKSLTNHEICLFGRAMMYKLYNGVSRRDIGIIFLLAYQLRSPVGGPEARTFAEAFPATIFSPHDLTVDDLDKTILQHHHPTYFEDIKDSSNENESARAYAFVAASLLRLFAKSPESYGKAWPHILKGYTTFYGRHFPLGRTEPNAEVIRCIHCRFSMDDIYRKTLYRILYVAGGVSRDQDVKNFLYENHLSFTGMLIVPLFSKLVDIFNITPETLLRALKNPEYKRQLVSITRVLELMADNSGKHRKQLWKYGRIFDQHFFCYLQTRRCPKLVYIMASAVKAERPEGHERILEIKQMQDNISEPDQKRCAMCGEALRRMLRGEGSSDLSCKKQ